MRKHTPILVLIITIAALIIQANAAIAQSATPANVCIVIQCPPTWSPFGPREKNLNITEYSDPFSEFNAFQSGQVDIMDSELLGSQQNGCFQNDMYCSSQQTSYRIFDLEINHMESFLGTSLQTSRPASQPSLMLPVNSTSGNCGLGSGQLTIRLENREQGNATILDALNKLTITSQPIATSTSSTADSGGTQPTGIYPFPCIIAGTYKITSSVYNVTAPCSTTMPTSCVSIGNGQSITANLLATWNSPSTKQPTVAGEYVPRALAHLIDKPSFVKGAPLGGTGVYDDEWASPAQNLPNLFSLTAECSDHPWFNPCNPVSAYNFASDSISAGSEWWTQPGASAGASNGYSGVADLRAACDDLVKAGFTVVNGANSTDCGDVALASQGTTAPAAYAHLSNNGQQLLVVIRAEQVRKAYGQIIADSINFLFGTPNNGQTFSNQTPQCTITYLGSTLLPCHSAYVGFLGAQCVFNFPLGIMGGPCPWNLYTGGFGLYPTPEQLFDYFHSSFAANVCGGHSGTAQDYFFYCDPKYDTDAFAGEFSSTSSQAYQFFARAAATGIQDGMALPIYTPVAMYAALNGWNQQCSGCAITESSLVEVKGNGFAAGSGFWSALNMRQSTSYVPSNPIYQPGGGDADLIRRGFSEETITLSPFQAYTPWDLEVVSLIYDSMLQTDPYTLGTDGKFIDWQTMSHSSIFNPNEVSCNAKNGCVTGTTTVTWHLRSDLFFQDGTHVTADDLVYSTLAYRDVPSVTFGYDVASVSSAIALSSTTMQVKLQGNAFNAITNLGMIPIIPAHVWTPICGPIVNGMIPSGPSSSCADPTFDPMTQGIMIGDGPWICAVPSGYGFPNPGHIGGSCVVATCNGTPCLGGQSVTTGSKILLSRNNGYMRCCPDDTSTSLYKFSWADKFNEGIVSASDIGDAAFHWKQPNAYWVNANIEPGSTVDIGTLSTIAFYNQNGIVGNFKWQDMANIDPQIDPFFCPVNGC